MKNYITMGILIFTLGASLTSHAKGSEKICASYKAKVKFLKGSNSKSEPYGKILDAKAKNCKGTAQWGNSGGEAKNKKYMILVYFNLGEFKTGRPEGDAALKKRFAGSWGQQVIFFHSELLSTQQWNEKFKKSESAGKGTIILSGKLKTVPVRVSSTGTSFTDRIAKINIKTSFTDLGLTDKASKDFWVDNKLEITLDVPVSEIKGNRPHFK